MTKKRLAIVLVFLALPLAWASRHAHSGTEAKKAPAPASVPSFSRAIRPLLHAKCTRCHGEKVRRAGLDLRTLASALAGGESGPAIVAGQPDKSLLYEKTHSGAMPPAKKDRLSAAEIDVLRR